MKKINNFSIFAFLAGFSISSQVFAYPLPTFSMPEIGQEIASYVSEANKTKSEIESTQDLIKKGVLAGVPGYLEAIQSGDWNGLMKGMATNGYNIYKQEAEKKKKAEEEAQKEAQANAQEKLQAQADAAQATNNAVNENRETAAKNRKAKVMSWIKKPGVNKIADGLFGDSQISSAIRNATDKLSSQAKKNKEGDKKDAGDAQNKPNES